MNQEPTPNEFARLLVVHRAVRQWTQEGLARQVGVSPEYMSAVVNRKRPVSARLVMQISRALDLSPEEEQRLLAAAGHGASARKGHDSEGRKLRHSSPRAIVEEDPTDVLRAVLRRLELLENEVRDIRDIVERALQGLEGETT